MRKCILILALGLACTTAFIVSPLYSAWAIRAAIKGGDAAYLVDRIDWKSVKPTLKESIGHLALGTPQKTKRTLWQRIKGYYGRSMVSRMVERYATPHGLPRLFSYGRTVRHDILRQKDPVAELSPLGRLSHLWSRVRRAEFKTPTRFELDLADKYDRNRIYCGVLSLRGLTWVLTELRVRIRPPAQIAKLIPAG